MEHLEFFIIFSVMAAGSLVILFPFCAAAFLSAELFVRFSGRPEKGKEEERMGMMYEFGTVPEDGRICLAHTQAGQCVELGIYAVPGTYDVSINGDRLVYSCSELDNAVALYQIIRADMKGSIWNGEKSTS